MSILNLIIVIVGIILTVLWIALPIVVIQMSSTLDKILKELRK